MTITTDRRAFLTQTVGALAGVALLPHAPDTVLAWQGSPRKVGIVGAGRQGRAIVAELLKIPVAEIAAVCDVVPARLEAMKGRTKGAEGFADHRQLLEKRADVDVIIVATPTHLHRAIVTDALQAGRHVFCEAPLASTVDDATAIAAAAAGAKTVFQAGFQGRSNPIYRRAQPLMQTEVRELVTMRAQSNRKNSWRIPPPSGVSEQEANWRLDPEVSIGLPGEVGAQQFDVFGWYRAAYPVKVTGQGAVRLHTDGRTVADTVRLDLEWPDGLTLRYDATLATSFGSQYEIVSGANATVQLAWTHGWLFKEADAPTQGWEVYATRQQVLNDEGIVLLADATKLAAQGELKAGAGLPYPSLYYALADFMKSVTEGARVACTAEDGARATIVGILANQAVVTGKTIEIPKFAPASPAVAGE
jgi:predicted dehydrogenase